MHQQDFIILNQDNMLIISSRYVEMISTFSIFVMTQTWHNACSHLNSHFCYLKQLPYFLIKLTIKFNFLLIQTSSQDEKRKILFTQQPIFPNNFNFNQSFGPSNIIKSNPTLSCLIFYRGLATVIYIRNLKILTIIIFQSMNTFQQVQATKFHSEEKDQVTTQAETFMGFENQTFSEKIAENIPILTKQILRHHDISAKISEGTFSSDKILRMFSAILKVIRNFGILNNLKSLEKLSGQVGQLRRLLRYDRLLMIIKEHAGFYKKGRMTKIQKIMVLFKLMIIFGDFNDILAFFVQLKVVSNEKILGNLKKNVANIYFFECLGWLCYHIYEYAHSKDEEVKQKNKMMIIKYVMDSLTSHNDFSKRLFTINPKLASLIGAASSFLNLYLIWK